MIIAKRLTLSIVTLVLLAGMGVIFLLALVLILLFALTADSPADPPAATEVEEVQEADGGTAFSPSPGG
jgi:uncharacterized protein (DUF58 family)